MSWVHINNGCKSQSVNVTGAVESMSRVHMNTECISHSVNVTGADGQCHGCTSILSVNHTQSMSLVQLSQCHGCRHTIRWGAL